MFKLISALWNYWSRIQMNIQSWLCYIKILVSSNFPRSPWDDSAVVQVLWVRQEMLNILDQILYFLVLVSFGHNIDIYADFSSLLYLISLLFSHLSASLIDVSSVSLLVKSVLYLKKKICSVSSTIVRKICQSVIYLILPVRQRT